MAGCAGSLLDDTMWKCKANVCFSWGCRQAAQGLSLTINLCCLLQVLLEFYGVWPSPVFCLSVLHAPWRKLSQKLLFGREPQPQTWSCWHLFCLSLDHRKKKKNTAPVLCAGEFSQNKKPFCDILEEGAVTPVVIKRLELNYLQRRRRNRLLCYFCPTKLTAKCKK